MTQHTFHYPHSFLLECGESLPELHLAYVTYGTLNARKDNVIWVCHALTANAHIEEWWEGLIGPGKLLDTRHYFIVCVNMPGSCYGSTYALSPHPLTQTPYFYDFPLISIRDMVQAYDHLRQSLGINRIFVCLGGSLGGQQVLEWAIMNPHLFEHIVPIATNVRHSAWGIAYNEAQRMSIEADDTWGTLSPEAGTKGMLAARATALLSYRSYDAYNRTQTNEDDPLEGFRAISYQRYQGEKLARRFDAFAYWTLSKAMDSHNVGRARGGVATAMGLIQARTLTIAINSDVLFPPIEQKTIADLVPRGQFREIESGYGHDGFLIETEKLTSVITPFLAQVKTSP